MVYRTVGKVTPGVINVNDFVAGGFVGGANNSRGRVGGGAELKAATAARVAAAARQARGSMSALTTRPAATAASASPARASG